jgi:hypothetical protein
MKSKTTHRLGMASLVIALAAPMCGEAQAYTFAATCEEGLPLRWQDAPVIPTVRMGINRTDFPEGSSWDARLQTAMSRWNSVKGSDLTFLVASDTNGVRYGNDVNEIYTGNSGFGPGVLAVTKIRGHSYWYFGTRCVFDEADIVFNSNISWSTDAYSYATPYFAPYSFEGVALHELGHALGLGHMNATLATMSDTYPGPGPLGAVKEWTPVGDDRLGVRVLYPDGTSESDLATSPLKRTGEGTSALVSSPLFATRGSSIPIEYTVSNLGTSSQTFEVGFYLSTNSNISTIDRLLGTTAGVQLAPGRTRTYSRTLYIPTSVAPGTYHLGLIIDPDRVAADEHRGNNTGNMPRTITVN